ncbi:FAD-dependent oxidoreductase [Clostridiales bacterium PH28_bin88]|nr:FAD-dependent oxidoreductase [Clostridiales bacterium PH28_bin88]
MPARVVVVGGGAAGMLAAIAAAETGAPVVLLEKNSRLGTKVLISGKGRCNLTNAADITGLVDNIPGNGQFLYSALHTFSNKDMVALLNRLGLPTKVERGGRVFPVSDRSKDVVQALEGYLRRLGVEVRVNLPVAGLLVEGNRVTGVKAGGGTVPGKAVVVATGGMSYPRTGSTGDGYRWAAELGHRITPLKPALVPLETNEEWVKDLQGLTLKNVEVSTWGKDSLGSEFGEMLFTHFGVSGPIILTLSRNVSRYLERHGPPVRAEINLKPALRREQLDARLQRDFAQFSRRQLKNSLGELLPQRLIRVFTHLSGLPEDKFVHQITREERLHLAYLLQHLPLTVTGTRPLAEAIVTAGGVSVKEIEPQTMGSRLVRGLYFAGEVLDVDGYTGGFNLQAAFSTGFVAGKSAAAVPGD